MRLTIRQRISLGIIALVMAILFLFSMLSQTAIRREFQSYLKDQQKKKAETMVLSLSTSYEAQNQEWKLDEIHAIGMAALYDGYIIKLSDMEGNSIWDAETHDMGLCNQVRNEIITRMDHKGLESGGKFSTKQYQLLQERVMIGSVSISFYGPFFYSQEDFSFLHTLTMITYLIGGVAVILAIVMGTILARNISKPILNAVQTTNQIANGDYSVLSLLDSKIIELNELSASINKMTDSIVAQENLRKQLTADVAHELRTPLTAVSTHLEAMLEGLWEPTMERLLSCHEEVNRIIFLVKDLEQLEVIENNRYQLQYTTFSLNDLVTKVCHNFMIQMEEKELQLTITGEQIELYADYDRITQVMVNLLSNAIKFTNGGDEIRIHMNQEKDKTILSIIDTGIGISKEQLPYVFERFYRVDKSRNRKTGGAGIGLTIVSSILAAHKGTISIDSEIGIGTTVRLEFIRQGS